ncbi:MAG: hypothetical protein PHI88_01205 [Candidatus Pacebacteria bacterium]|nr:hypothetical protein [Candidatus Paceibacterota bacterium]
MEEEYEEDDQYLSCYQRSDPEAYMLKMILMYHEIRDDLGFSVKELSLNRDKIEDICNVLNVLEIDKIINILPNTSPEILFNEKENLPLDFVKAKKMDRDHKLIPKWFFFEIEVINLSKLKNRLDVIIEDFINDRILMPQGIFPLPKTSMSYEVQKGLFLQKILRTYDPGNKIITWFNDFKKTKISFIKVILGLEKENIIRIKELRNDATLNDSGEFKPDWFEKDNVCAEIQMLNYELAKELAGYSKTGRDIGHSMTFDESKGVLFIGDKRIKTTKFSNQYNMLKVIFKDDYSKKMDWQYSEIMEIIDFQQDWESLYNVAYALNNKIAKETGIKDFFITTKQSVKINPKYL